MLESRALLLDDLAAQQVERLDAGRAFVQRGDAGVARQLLPADREVFRMQSALPFGIVVYGYGAFTSYMYPGGLDLKKIAPAIIR